MTQPKKRIQWVDISKGIGIILVVVFHYGPGTWWPAAFSLLARLVYKFHMPLFMLLSGYLFTFDATRVERFWPEYWRLLGKKGGRLLVPYLSVSGIYLAAKMAGQGFFAWNPITMDVVLNVLVRPTDGPASLLWFIYCLAVFVAAFPLVHRLVRSDILLLVLCLGLYYVPTTTLFAGDRLAYFFPCFVLGFVCRKHAVIERIWPEVGFVISAIVFVGICAVAPTGYLGSPPPVAFAGAVAGSLMTIFFAVILENHRVRLGDHVLSLIGRHSAAIYLLHQPFAWLPPVVLHQYCGIGGYTLLYALPASMALGLACPVFLELVVMSRSPRLSSAILGGRAAAL